MEDSADIEMLLDREEMESIKKALEELKRGELINEADFLRKYDDVLK